MANSSLHRYMGNFRVKSVDVGAVPVGRLAEDQQEDLARRKPELTGLDAVHLEKVSFTPPDA